MTSYALDNQHAASADHHANLANLFDPGTRRRIQQLPVWGRARYCLEVGAGAATISTWLAQQLPPDGLATAVDLHPTPVAAHPRLRIITHDLTDPAPLGGILGDGYHLIVARMVLVHLPQREQLITRLAHLLTAGGTLLVEDWVTTTDPGVVIAPTDEDRQLWARYRAAVTACFAASGVEHGWGARVWPVMHEAGLVDLDTRVSTEYWAGGHPGMALTATSAAQLAPRLFEAGLTHQDLDRIRELTRDPRMVVHGHPMYSTAGTRPA